MKIKYLEANTKKVYQQFRHMSDGAKKEYARIMCMYYREESTLLGIANKINLQFASSEHGYLNELKALVVDNENSICIWYNKSACQSFDLVVETLHDGNLKEMVVFQNNDTKKYFSKCVWDMEYDKATHGSKIMCIVGEYTPLNEIIAGNIADELNRQHNKEEVKKFNDIALNETR